MKVGAYLTGAFGQSDAYYKARNELGRRGSVNPRERQLLTDTAEDQLFADTKRVLNLQQAAGFSYVIDPMFRVFSIFHALTQGVKNIREGPQNPWAKNLFYNWPIIEGPIDTDDIGFTERLISADLLPKGKASVVLPSPYAVLMASDVKGYQDPRSTLRSIAQLLYNEARNLVKKGAVRIQYDEPVVAMKQSRGSLSIEDLSLLEEAMGTCGKVEGATTSLHTYFGDVSPLLPFLNGLPVDCIGIDGTRTSIDQLARHRMDEKQLAVGLVDGKSAFMEDPRELAEKLRRIMEETGPRELFLTPNHSTEYIGFALAAQKIDVMRRTLQELARDG